MHCLFISKVSSLFLFAGDISTLVDKIDDPDMAAYEGLLDDACSDAGFFGVVITRSTLWWQCGPLSRLCKTGKTFYAFVIY